MVIEGRTDVISEPSGTSKLRPMKEAHFATFPPTLVDPCIKLASHTSDIILDPFLGAGITGIVARGANRRFVGIELNPNYVSIARNRLAAG